MGLASLGVPSMILIVIVALIIFGPKKLPEIGKATGETLKEFKNSAHDVMTHDDANESESTEQKQSQN